jgi:hypothetical protein
MWFVVIAGFYLGQLVELEILKMPSQQHCRGMAEHTRPTLPPKLIVMCVGPDGEI